VSMLGRCLGQAGVALATMCLAASAAQKREWPVSTKIEGELTPNEWVKVEEHGAARRSFPSLVWLPGEKAFLLAMGTVGAWDDHGPFVYDELTFTFGSRLWENRFLPGKEGWGPQVGICTPPPIPSHGYRIKDKEGNPRLGLWEGGFAAYSQYAFDSDRNRLLAYTHNRLIEYDPVARTWKELAPGTPSGDEHKLWWGSLCYDAHNKELLLFGGNNGPSEFNDTRTWAYSPAGGQWRRIECGGDLVKGFDAKVRAIHEQAVALHGAYCNRYFKTELPENAKGSLDESAKKLAVATEAMRKGIEGKGSGYAKTQCERAAAELDAAAALAAKLGDEASPETIKAALALSRTLWSARCALMSEPPPRAHSQMAYDPATKKIILFGGDRLDMLYADTWVYDGATRAWEERRPEVSPSPRAGHAMLRLPASGKLVLLGGYRFDSDTGYWGPLYRQLPVQAWTYDIAANRWQLIKDWGKPVPSFMGSKGANMVAAASDEDVILALSNERRGERGTTVTLACKLDASQPDAAGTEKLGVRSGSVEWRVGPYDPDWYLDGPPPDEAAFQARLAAVPANTWTIVTDKSTRLPKQNRDWGTAVYDTDRQAIYRWSGGHSAHCGSDIPVFSMRTGQYHIKYPPAFPLENIGSCGSQPSRATFLGQPWISAHSYHSYAYDPVSRKVLCCGHESFSFAYDPESGTWTHNPQPKGMREDNYYTLTLCSTPTGPYAWTRFGTLFRYDAGGREWSEVKVSGEKLPGTRCDESGMCYDSKRGRLILTHPSLQGDLLAVDLKTLTAAKLSPHGMAEAAAGGIFLRETCYDAANDCVFVLTRHSLRKDPESPWWPVYNCQKNAWVNVKITGVGDANRGKPGPPKWDGCSNGLMYDPLRKLILAVDTSSVVYALHLNPNSTQAAEPR